jgi:hypothetical protein
MSPNDFVEQIGKLVSACRDQEALDFYAQHELTVRHCLTADQRDHVAWMLEGAVMAIGLKEWEDAQQRPEDTDAALAVAEDQSGRSGYPGVSFGAEGRHAR